MSFETKIVSIFESGTTLKNLVNNQIYLQKLDINKLINNSAIVYNYYVDNRIDILSQKSVVIEYSLFIDILSDSRKNLESITIELYSLINNYSDSNIRDIQFIKEFNETELDKNIYKKYIEYKVIYEE